ncbi:hypothetical protein DOY81_011781 [Sarcophaga bullata]|nr:hypothetical protein DOY81_011781 [Sarcophaga bullata]
MSLIKNLIKDSDPTEKSKDDPANKSDVDSKDPKPIIKSALDLQRLKLEKLMKNPEKPVIIPEYRKERDFLQSVPTFVRNVMGSSAGAGSGEFHVYRHLRRKEYARQKIIQSKSLQEQLDEEYRNKLEENRRRAEEKTAKKRAKRQKKKRLSKKPKGSAPVSNNSEIMSEESSSDSSERDHTAETKNMDCKNQNHAVESSGQNGETNNTNSVKNNFE